MSSVFIAGYAILCIMVFAVVNFVLRKRTTTDEQQSTVIQKEEVMQPSVSQQTVAEEVEEELISPVEVEIPDVDEASQKPIVTEETDETPVRKEFAPQSGAPAFSVKAVLLVLVVGMFISILNQTVINVALPVLMNEFSVSTATAQWLSTGFMLVNGMLVPISAYLIQTFTYRKLFIVAMIFFTIGSFICAVSTNFPIMLTGRLVQAVGAGILMPTGMNVFMTIFPPEKRGAAMGLLGIAMILAPAIGPTIAGWLVQNYTWNIMFYVMGAGGIVIILMALRWFTLKQPLSKPKFDLPGALASSIGLGSLLYGFSQAGNNGWDSTEVVSTLVIGVIGIAIFVWWELVAETKLLDLTVFKIPAFSFTLFINLIITMALFGGMLLLPVYLQNIRGFTPIDAGLLLLPGSLVMGLMGPFAGKLFDRYGIRPLAIFGLILMVYGTWELTQLSLDTSYYSIMGIYVLRSFGMAFIMMPIMTAGMNALPPNKISDGTALQNTLRSVAGSIGTAVLITIMTRQSTFHTADYANALSSTDPIMMNGMGKISQGLAAALGIPLQSATPVSTVALYGQVVKLSTINGINDAFLVAMVLAVVALVLSFFLHPGNVIRKKAEK